MLDYEERLAVLLAAGIGLWDTIASARRIGSLDTAIREVDAAPLQSVIEPLQMLRAVAFNGARSAAIGRRFLGETSLSLIDLPSSSPANAAIRLADKRARWLELQQFLA